MFSLMANCFTWIKKRREPRKKVTILMVGLDNAGKTSTVARVKGENVENIAPTVGFLMANFTFEKSEVTIFDLGGGPKIRGIWKDYFAEIYGIVYVVDSSDEIRIDEAKKVLHDLISQGRVAGKPLLVLANKKDKEGAMSELEIDQRLELSHLSEKNRSPYQVYSCSAVLGTGNKLDKQIKKGLQWLLSSINDNYPTLLERITNDVAIQKEEDAKELARVRERVRKAREERERAEAQEAQEKEDESDDDLVIGTKKKKQITSPDEGEKTPEVKRKKKRKKKKKIIESGHEHEGENIELQTSARFEKSPLPPLTKVKNEIAEDSDTIEESKIKPKKRRHKKKHLKDEHNEVENIPDYTEHKNGPLRTSSLDKEEHEENELHSHRRHEHRQIVNDNHIEQNNEIIEDDIVQNDQGENISSELNVKKKKKKKKKLKANKTAPAPEEEDGETDKLSPLGWGTPPLMNGFGHVRAPPRLEPLRPPLRSTFDSRNIGESIQEQSEDDSPVLKHPLARYRPNSEDYDIVT